MKLTIVIILIVFALLLVPVFRILAKQMKEDSNNRKVYEQTLEQERIKVMQESGKHENSQQEKVKEESGLIKFIKLILYICVASFVQAYLFYTGYAWWIKILVLLGGIIAIYLINIFFKILFSNADKRTIDGGESDKNNKDSDITEIPG